MSTTVPSYYASPIRPSHPDLLSESNPSININGNSATFNIVNVGTGTFISSTGAVFNEVDVLTANMETVTVTDLTVDSIVVPSLVQQKTYNGLTYNTTSGQVGYFPYNLTPPGVICPFAGTGAPSGWLLCDGREVSRSVYLDLFNTIGTIYGVGNGVSSFNIPNLKGRIPAGFDATQTYYDSFGKTGGYNTHTLTIPEMPTHNHGITDPGHSHSYFNQPNTVNPAVSLTTTDVADNVNVNQTTGVSTTGITINNTGNSQPHNNLQPYLVIQYIIKF